MLNYILCLFFLLCSYAIADDAFDAPVTPEEMKGMKELRSDRSWGKINTPDGDLFYLREYPGSSEKSVSQYLNIFPCILIKEYSAYRMINGELKAASNLLLFKIDGQYRLFPFPHFSCEGTYEQCLDWWNRGLIKGPLVERLGPQIVRFILGRNTPLSSEEKKVVFDYWLLDSQRLIWAAIKEKDPLNHHVDPIQGKGSVLINILGQDPSLIHAIHEYSCEKRKANEKIKKGLELTLNKMIAGLKGFPPSSDDYILIILTGSVTELLTTYQGGDHESFLSIIWALYGADCSVDLFVTNAQARIEAFKEINILPSPQHASKGTSKFANALAIAHDEALRVEFVQVQNAAQEEVASLREQLAQSQASEQTKSEGLQAEIEAMRAQVHTQNAQAQEEGANLRKQVEESQSIAAVLKAQLAQLKIELEGSQSQVHLSQTDAAALRAESEELQAEIEAMRAQVNTQNAQAQEEVASLREQLTQSQADAAALRTKSEGLQAEIEALRAQVNTQDAQADAAALRAQLAQPQERRNNPPTQETSVARAPSTDSSQPKTFFESLREKLFS